MLAWPASENLEHVQTAERSPRQRKARILLQPSGSPSLRHVHDDTGIEQIIFQLQDEVAKQELVLASANEEFVASYQASAVQQHEHYLWSCAENMTEKSHCAEISLVCLELDEEQQACACDHEESMLLAEEIRGCDEELQLGRLSTQNEVSAIRSCEQGTEAVLRWELVARSYQLQAPREQSFNEHQAQARALEECCARALHDGERAGQEVLAASLRAFHHAQRCRLEMAEAESAERRAAWLERARRLRELLAQGRRGQERLRGELLGLETLAAGGGASGAGGRG